MRLLSWLLWPYSPFLIPSISSAPQLLPYDLVLLTYNCAFLFMFIYSFKLSRYDCALLVVRKLEGEGGHCDSGGLGANHAALFWHSIRYLQGTLIHVHVIPVHSHLNGKMEVEGFLSKSQNRG